MPDVALPKSELSQDHRLAQLLLALTVQLRQGLFPDLEEMARQHPDLADELRALWPAILIAEEIGRTHSDVAPPPDEEGASALRLTHPTTLGDYEVLEELGRGGMGVVYKAWQRSLKRTVAMKMILRSEFASAADIDRLRAEAESAARLNHPNIVPVYEIGDWDGQPYFTMKYVEGRTLSQLVAEHPLPPRDAARYLADVARAVHHAHQNGILHRDLKPSNILIDREDSPHVTDFGLAKRVEAGASLTQSGAIVGTPSYMPPEQAAGNRGLLSPASDIYSLGAILYQLLTGRPPFQAASPVDTIMLVLEQEPVPPRVLNPKVDRELEMICLKCLQKPADLRYRTAARLADDLEAFLNGEPVSARSSNIAHVVSRMLRPTHHAAVLENWGLLWMWNSLALFVLCSITHWMQWQQVAGAGWYLLLWAGGLSGWASIFWALRQRGGPVTFVERQIAHGWAAGVSASVGIFIIEMLLGLKVLTLAPVMAVVSGMVFLVKAGTLSGSFYLAAVAQYLTALLMALFPDWGLLIFGLVSAACFFLPGLKYYRQRARPDLPLR